MRPRLKVWVVFEGRTKLGEGRARLFELIDETGSIRQAVARMGMSYRAAWGYIRELETAAGFRFLDLRPGGGGTGGARLTREGRQFLDRYRGFRKSLDQLVTRRFARVFDEPRAHQIGVLPRAPRRDRGTPPSDSRTS
jgi:molybdate transport system regulatory protein